MAGWLHGVFVGEWLFVFPLCGFSLSLFCNYICDFVTTSAVDREEESVLLARSRRRARPSVPERILIEKRDGWLVAVCVSACLLVPPQCGFCLSLFCKTILIAPAHAVSLKLEVKSQPCLRDSWWPEAARGSHSFGGRRFMVHPYKRGAAHALCF